jgi:hypothetical protein
MHGDESDSVNQVSVTLSPAVPGKMVQSHHGAATVSGE